MKKEYLNNLFYDIYKNYPLFIFKEFKDGLGNNINYLNIKKIKYDSKKKIIFLIEDRDSFLYIPLANVNNINNKFFSDIVKLDYVDMAIISSIKNFEDLDNDELIDLEYNFKLEGKKIPFEFMKN